MRREFSDQERWILYDLAGGKCQQCSKELYGVFHADHVRPYSKGGPTYISNGQVLCEGCNRMKSDHYSSIPDWNVQLRRWQAEAFTKWLSKQEKGFLANVTPGAGKTWFGLRVAHHELTSGRVQRLLIVVPSENLRSQWANEAALFGINLATDHDAGFSLASDYHGVVTTYQTLAARRDNRQSTFRKYTSALPTLAILDEIHHVGSSLSWANGHADSVEPCVDYLNVTGTAFRSDRLQIPFVRYKTNIDGNQECIPDYTYGYGDALRDGVVRPVYFQTFDGDVSWFDQNGSLNEHRVSDSLPQYLAAQRLRMTVDHRGNWLQEVLSDAHSRLMEVRREDPTAAGLVVTKDKDHAIAVAKVLEKVVGENPVVVTYDVEGASDEIERFRKSQDKWIVAVKMVSEGVDIKRLRVGVWATNIQTELFFRQVVGRLVRMVDEPEDQYSYQYIPKLEPLTGFAEQMKRERAHVIDDLDSIADELEEMNGDDEHIDKTIGSIFLGSTGEKSVLIHDDTSLTLQEMEMARQELRVCGIECTNHNAIVAAKILRHSRPTVQVKRSEMPESTPQHTNGDTPEKRMGLRKKELRDKIKRMLRPIIEASNGMVSYEDINRQLNFAHSVRKIDECTYEQLLERQDALVAWLEAWNNGTGRQFTVKGYLHQRASNIAG